MNTNTFSVYIGDTNTKKLAATFDHFPDGAEFFGIPNCGLANLKVDEAFVYQCLNVMRAGLERKPDDGKVWFVALDVPEEYLEDPAKKLKLVVTKKAKV